MAIEITDANFEEIVGSGKPVLVDFWGDACPPCEKIAPDVEALSKEFEGRAIVGKINVNDNSRVPVQFGIRNIPTLLFFKDGKLVDKQVGAVSRSVLASKLEAQLK